MGVQDKEHAGHRLDAQGADELRRGGFQQGIGRVAAAVQRAQADLSLVQKLLGQAMNPFSKRKSAKQKRNTINLWCKIVVACLPAAVIGLLFDDILDKNS